MNNATSDLEIDKSSAPSFLDFSNFHVKSNNINATKKVFETLLNLITLHIEFENIDCVCGGFERGQIMFTIDLDINNGAAKIITVREEGCV